MNFLPKFPVQQISNFSKQIFKTYTSTKLSNQIETFAPPISSEAFKHISRECRTQSLPSLRHRPLQLQAIKRSLSPESEDITKVEFKVPPGCKETDLLELCKKFASASQPTKTTNLSYYPQHSATFTTMSAKTSVTYRIPAKYRQYGTFKDICKKLKSLCKRKPPAKEKLITAPNMKMRIIPEKRSSTKTQLEVEPARVKSQKRVNSKKEGPASPVKILCPKTPSQIMPCKSPHKPEISGPEQQPCAKPEKLSCKSEPEIVCPQPPDPSGPVCPPFFYKKVCVKTENGMCVKYEMQRVPLVPKMESKPCPRPPEGSLCDTPKPKCQPFKEPSKKVECEEVPPVKESVVTIKELCDKLKSPPTKNKSKTPIDKPKKPSVKKSEDRKEKEKPQKDKIKKPKPTSKPPKKSLTSIKEHKDPCLPPQFDLPNLNKQECAAKPLKKKNPCVRKKWKPAGLEKPPCNRPENKTCPCSSQKKVKKATFTCPKKPVVKCCPKFPFRCPDQKKKDPCEKKKDPPCKKPDPCKAKSDPCKQPDPCEVNSKLSCEENKNKALKSNICKDKSDPPCPKPKPKCPEPDPPCPKPKPKCPEPDPPCPKPKPKCSESEPPCPKPKPKCPEPDPPCPKPECPKLDPCCPSPDTCCPPPDPCCPPGCPKPGCPKPGCPKPNPCCPKPDPCCPKPDPCCPPPDPCCPPGCPKPGCPNPNPCCPKPEPCPKANPCCPKPKPSPYPKPCCPPPKPCCPKPKSCSSDYNSRQQAYGDTCQSLNTSRNKPIPCAPPEKPPQPVGTPRSKPNPKPKCPKCDPCHQSESTKPNKKHKNVSRDKVPVKCNSFNYNAPTDKLCKRTFCQYHVTRELKSVPVLNVMNKNRLAPGLENHRSLQALKKEEMFAVRPQSMTLLGKNTAIKKDPETKKELKDPGLFVEKRDPLKTYCKIDPNNVFTVIEDPTGKITSLLLKTKTPCKEQGGNKKLPTEPKKKSSCKKPDPCDISQNLCEDRVDTPKAFVSHARCKRTDPAFPPPKCKPCVPERPKSCLSAEIKCAKIEKPCDKPKPCCEPPKTSGSSKQHCCKPSAPCLPRLPCSPCLPPKPRPSASEPLCQRKPLACPCKTIKKEVKVEHSPCIKEQNSPCQMCKKPETCPTKIELINKPVKCTAKKCCAKPKCNPPPATPRRCGRRKSCPCPCSPCPPCPPPQRSVGPTAAEPITCKDIPEQFSARCGNGSCSQKACKKAKKPTVCTKAPPKKEKKMSKDSDACKSKVRIKKKKQNVARIKVCSKEIPKKKPSEKPKKSDSKGKIMPKPSQGSPTLKHMEWKAVPLECNKKEQVLKKPDKKAGKCSQPGTCGMVKETKATKRDKGFFKTCCDMCLKVLQRQTKKTPPGSTKRRFSTDARSTKSVLQVTYKCNKARWMRKQW